MGIWNRRGEAPAYDVVIANSVAYEGIDLHIRTCVVHHLDLPWNRRPFSSAMDAPCGKGIRRRSSPSCTTLRRGSIDARGSPSSSES